VAIDALNKSSTKYFSKQKQSSYVLQRVPFLGNWWMDIGCWFPEGRKTVKVMQSLHASLGETQGAEAEQRT